MSLLEKPIVFMDLETTGKDISFDRICEIGLVKYQNNSIVDKLHFYIDPEIPISAEASMVHGLKRNEGKLINAKPFYFYTPQIKNFLQGCNIGGHRILAFDIPILVEEFLRCSIDFPVGDILFIDTYEIQAKLFPRTLAFSYEQMTGKTFNHELAHSAIYDSEISCELFQAQAQNSDDIDNLCKREKPIIDFAGKLKLNDNGLICYAFGKHEGKRVSSYLDYLNWMMSGGFTLDTKNWLQQCIKYHDNYQEIVKSKANVETKNPD